MQILLKCHLALMPHFVNEDTCEVGIVKFYSTFQKPYENLILYIIKL